MPLEILSFKQVLALPDTFNWLIDGIAPEIGTGFIAGRFSVGKSWLTQSLVLSVATGKKWLGKFPVKQGQVLVIDEENAQPLITQRMKQLCAGMGINPKVDIPISYAIKQRMNFSVDSKGRPSKSYDDLCRWSQKNNPVMIISDSLTRVHTNNEDRSYEMRPVFENIDKFCQKFKTVSIFTHHSGHDGDRMRGTVDIYGASDWSLFVKRSGDAKDMKLMVTQDRARWASAVDPFEVRMKQSPGSFRVVYNGKNETELDRDSQSLLDLIHKHGELENNILMGKSKFSQATFYRLRKTLLDREYICIDKSSGHSIISLKSDNNGFSPSKNGHKKR